MFFGDLHPVVARLAFMGGDFLDPVEQIAFTKVAEGGAKPARVIKKLAISPEPEHIANLVGPGQRYAAICKLGFKRLNLIVYPCRGA